LENIIYESCKIKAKIVSQDERESGVRAHLNFGHTFGHAIEAIEQYKNLLHGEAVGIGMHMASLVSMRIGALDKNAYEEIYEGLCKFGFLPKYNKYSTNELLQKIRLDKKNNASRFRFILLSDIGKAFIHEVPSVSKLKKLISLAF
jgi:3-dehydroquinate synthase